MAFIQRFHILQTSEEGWGRRTTCKWSQARKLHWLLFQSTLWTLAANSKNCTHFSGQPWHTVDTRNKPTYTLVCQLPFITGGLQNNSARQRIIPIVLTGTKGEGHRTWEKQNLVQLQRKFETKLRGSARGTCAKASAKRLARNDSAFLKPWALKKRRPRGRTTHTSCSEIACIKEQRYSPFPAEVGQGVCGWGSQPALAPLDAHAPHQVAFERLVVTINSQVRRTRALIGRERVGRSGPWLLRSPSVARSLHPWACG